MFEAGILWLLVAVEVVLPFEVRLFRVEPFEITLPELLLYALILAWGAGAVLRSPVSLARPGRAIRTALGRARREPLPVCVAGLMLVVVISAALAGHHRTEALKFALRTLSGGLFYFVARDLARRPGAGRRIVAGILVGAVLSAALTFVETGWPSWTTWWQPFRPQEYSVAGLARASGPFGFPNIAGMYWEAALPLLLVLWDGPPPSSRRARIFRRAGVFALLAILLHAIVATASRASIFDAALIGIGFMLVGAVRRLSRGAWPARPWTSFGAAIVLIQAAVVAGALAQNGATPVLAQRLRQWNQTANTAPPEAAGAPATGASRSAPAEPTAIDHISRVEFWRAAVTLWRRAPLFGVGPDNFRHSYFEAIRAARPGIVGGDDRFHANNLYFETLADLGLAGLLALGALLVALIAAAKQGANRGRGDIDVVAVAAFLGAVAFAVHGMVDYFFAFTPTFGLWWSLIALAGRPAFEP